MILSIIHGGYDGGDIAEKRITPDSNDRYFYNHESSTKAFDCSNNY